MQRLKDPVGQIIVTQPLRSSLLHRAIERRAKEPDFDKIVEVTSLERGILPVIGKAEHLRLDGRSGPILAGLPQMADSREAQNRGRGATPFGTERSQPPKVVFLVEGIGNTTLE